MKIIISVILFTSFLFIQPGCKDVVDDVIDCTIESLSLSIHDNVDANNSKLVHFEFVNNDTDGSFTQDPNVNWDFGDGNTGTSADNKIDHTYTAAGDYKVVATYTLHKGNASCTGPKDKTVTIE